MSDAMADPQAEPAGTEVGKRRRDGELRFWLAGEALRNAELRLAAQAATLQSLEARAASLMQWSVTAVLALLAILATHPELQPAAERAGLMLAAAWGCAARATWPAEWGVAGYDPAELLEDASATELEVREACAKGYGDAITANKARLASGGEWLRRAWVCFAAAPVAAFLGLRV